jgi:hypothetical protein
VRLCLLHVGKAREHHVCTRGEGTLQRFQLWQQVTLSCDDCDNNLILLIWMLTANHYALLLLQVLPLERMLSKDYEATSKDGSANSCINFTFTGIHLVFAGVYS